MTIAPEKSKEIRIEMERETEPTRLYLLTGCRMDSATRDLFVTVMLFNNPALTRSKYRVVKKFPASAYEPLMSEFRERMKDEPSLKGILSSEQREYGVWQGYFCALVGSQVLTELLDDFRSESVEEIEWVVYGKGGRIIGAYLDRFFDLDYEQTSLSGVGAGSHRRHARYYGHAEEVFAKNQLKGISNTMGMLSKSLDIGVLLSAYTGVDPVDRSLPFDDASVILGCKTRARELKAKVSAVCVDKYVGVWSAGKESRL